MNNGAIEDVEIAETQNADLIHSFSEISGVIEKYLHAQSAENPVGVKWLKAIAKFSAVETFRALLKKEIEGRF